MSDAFIPSSIFAALDKVVQVNFLPTYITAGSEQEHDLFFTFNLRERGYYCLYSINDGGIECVSKEGGGKLATSYEQIHRHF